MAHKVKANSPLQPLSGLCGSLAAVSIALPNPYRTMLFGFSMLLLVALSLLIIFTSRKYRDLTFEDSALIFRKNMIGVEEIRYIFVSDKMSSVVLHFDKKWRPGVTIAFDRKSASEFRSELRQWAWKNGVHIKTEGSFKRSRG